MLEFEDQDQVPVKAEVNVDVKDGFVVVPLKTYTELLLDANTVPYVKVERSIFSKDCIDVKIDKDWLHCVAVGLLQLKYTQEELAEFDIIKADDMYIGEVTIAKRKQPVDDAEPDPF